MRAYSSVCIERRKNEAIQIVVQNIQAKQQPLEESERERELEALAASAVEEGRLAPKKGPGKDT
jgi:hypothetical protein